MNIALSIDEYDLLSFFGDGPTTLDEGIPWVYNDSTYVAGDSRARVSFAIAPAARDVRILLTSGGDCVFEFSASSVVDVRLHREKGRESLEVVVADGHSVWLSLQPHVSVRQSVEAHPTGG
jgi:hypothetical protein